MQVVMNKRFLLNPEKNLGADFVLSFSKPVLSGNHSFKKPETVLSPVNSFSTGY